MSNCGQPDRDAELLRKHAERFAVMALVNFPSDYESRKRIITSAIVAALKQSDPKVLTCPDHTHRHNDGCYSPDDNDHLRSDALRESDE